VEISLFDEAFLTEIAHMEQKNIAFESLKRLIKERVRQYARTSVVKSQKFSDMLQGTLNSYLNGMLTNAEVIEELVKMAKEIKRKVDKAFFLMIGDGLQRKETEMMITEAGLKDCTFITGW
jgi:type I restriction enzyme R subunit